MDALINGFWYGMGFTLGACFGLLVFLFFICLFFPAVKKKPPAKKPGV